MSDLESQATDCAGALIVREKRVLLGLRAPNSESYPNVWDIFGGHAEPGETLAQTLVRELREELDITPIAPTPFESFREPNPDRNGPRAYHVFLVADWTGPGPRMLGDEHVEIRWFALGDAVTLELAAPLYRQWFRRVL